MLTDTRNYYRLALGLSIQFFNDILWLYRLRFSVVTEWIFLLPIRDLSEPLTAILVLDFLTKLDKNVLGIPDHRNIHVNVLGYAARVYIYMDNFRFRRKTLEPARYPIVKTRSNRYQQIGVLNRVISIGAAVHTEHIERIFVVLVVASKP